MAKRRTRKDKINAKHNFQISWHESASKKESVKNQKKKNSVNRASKKNKSKNASYSVNNENLASIKKDIVKSITLASFVLGLEMVLYLFL